MLTKREMTVGAVLVLAAVGVSVTAGPLDPPAGPISPTSPSLGDLQTSLNAITASDGLISRSGIPSLGIAGVVADNAELQATGARMVLQVNGIEGTFLFTIADIRRGVKVVESGQGSAGATLDVVEPVTKIVLVRQFFGTNLGLIPDLTVWTEEVRADPEAPRRSATLTYFPPRLDDPSVNWTMTECLPVHYDVRIVGEDGYEVLELAVGSITQSIAPAQ